MKSTMLAVAFSTLLPPVALAQPGGGPPGTTPVGSATAQVYHALTGDALPGMPVVVRRVIDPDLPPTFSVFVTDEFGRALLFPLEDGVYDTWVEYNTHQSNVERFIIIADTDFHPVVTLWFNPDIDR